MRNAEPGGQLRLVGGHWGSRAFVETTGVEEVQGLGGVELVRWVWVWVWSWVHGCMVYLFVCLYIIVFQYVCLCMSVWTCVSIRKTLSSFWGASEGATV